MQEWVMKTRIYSGCDSFQRLSEIQSKKVWVVCDPFLKDSETLGKLLSHIDSSNQVEIFSDVVPEPPIEKVALGLGVITRFNPHIVIAIGGGSAIDQTKGIVFVMRQLLGDEVPNFEKMIAIPTTSGTGSEATSVFVLSDPKEQRKYPVFHPSVSPDEAILNPELILSCPPSVTAFSGMDVLSHGLEALVSLGANTYTDALAEKAIELVFKNLKTCVDQGNNLEARALMHEASCLAGMSFDAAGLGICHAISHQVGAIFHLPHGMVNAMLLPPVVEYNSQNPRACKKYAEVARKIGLASIHQSDKMAVRLLINRIQALGKDVSCPMKLSERGIKGVDAKAAMDEVVRNTPSDVTFAGNPIIPNSEDIRKIYLAIL